MQVDEASSEIVGVPVTNECQVLEEYTDIRHTGSGRHSQALPVPLVVTLYVGEVHTTVKTTSKIRTHASFIQ